MNAANTAARGLARCLNAPGGINAEQAYARAAMHLEALSEQALAFVDGALNEIELLAGDGGNARVRMHSLACSVAALGGTFGRPGLSKVAHCFCRLLDETAPAWDREAVIVHVYAMRLMLTPDDLDQAAQDAMIEGLAKVRLHAAREGETG